MSSFQGKVALVTGAASGIGLAIATRLAEQGALVAMADKQDPAPAAAALAAAGATTLPVLLDVTDPVGVQTGLDAVAATLGPVDLVVNSAGITAGGLAIEQDIEAFRAIVSVNLCGTFIVGQIAARQMLGRGGAILNIASVTATRGFPTRSAYCASKAGVWNLTQVMAVELAEYGIRVNALAPGPVDTPLSRATHTDAIRKAWNGVLPQQRYVQPGEIADAALYLLGSDAAYVTGHLLAVDGGFQAAGFTAHALEAATAAPAAA